MVPMANARTVVTIGIGTLVMIALPIALFYALMASEVRSLVA